ncbi:hypothetical protein CLOSCI_03953 [[Clostridium] scindens ATCC 35704]|nr:hypothetical protein CLOSCI_03953 [[Clostridium] scindens ATCC 35704]
MVVIIRREILEFYKHFLKNVLDFREPLPGVLSTTRICACSPPIFS